MSAISGHYHDGEGMVERVLEMGDMVENVQEMGDGMQVHSSFHTDIH